MASATDKRREIVEEALAAGNGILRLAPAWVARDFLPPGRRLGLKPDPGLDFTDRSTAGYAIRRRRHGAQTILQFKSNRLGDTERRGHQEQQDNVFHETFLCGAQR